MQQEEAPTALRASIDEECRDAEAKLSELRQLLLDVRPEALERCQGELRQIVAMLEGFVAQGALPRHPSVSSALLRIRRSAYILGRQIEFASNLCFGWIQLQLGAGYTQQGLPVLAAGEPGSSFEA
jgi:hypothetical protein